MGHSASKVKTQALTGSGKSTKKRGSKDLRQLKVRKQRGSKKGRQDVATVSFSIESPLSSECLSQADWEEVFHSESMIEYTPLGSRDSALLLTDNFRPPPVKSMSACVVFPGGTDQLSKEPLVTEAVERSETAPALFGQGIPNSTDSVCGSEHFPGVGTNSQLASENATDIRVRDETVVLESSDLPSSVSDKELPASVNLEVDIPVSTETVLVSQVREKILEESVCVSEVAKGPELEEKVVAAAGQEAQSGLASALDDKVEAIITVDTSSIQQNSTNNTQFKAVAIRDQGFPNTISSLCGEKSNTNTTTHSPAIPSSISCTNFTASHTEQATMSLSESLQLFSKDASSSPKSILLRMPKLSPRKGISSRNVRFQELSSDKSSVPKSVSLGDLR